MVDNQCEPTENQRGNADVQITKGVFVWRYDGTRLCGCVCLYCSLNMCVCVCVTSRPKHKDIRLQWGVEKDQNCVCVCVCWFPLGTECWDCQHWRFVCLRSVHVHFQLKPSTQTADSHEKSSFSFSSGSATSSSHTSSRLLHLSVTSTVYMSSMCEENISLQ